MKSITRRFKGYQQKTQLFKTLRANELTLLPSVVEIKKLDIKSFFKNIADDDNKIIFDNVLINNFNNLIINLYELENMSISSFYDGDYKKKLIRSYNIFIYYFIACLIKLNDKLYKLDKIVINNNTIYDISQLKLFSDDAYNRIYEDFKEPYDELIYNNDLYYYSFKECRTDEIIFGNFYKCLYIKDLINNKYLIYKTKLNEYIIFNKNIITKDDFENLCHLNGSTLIINYNFNLPIFLIENDTEPLIKRLIKRL